MSGEDVFEIVYLSFLSDSISLHDALAIRSLTKFWYGIIMKDIKLWKRFYWEKNRVLSWCDDTPTSEFIPNFPIPNFPRDPNDQEDAIIKDILSKRHEHFSHVIYVPSWKMGLCVRAFRWELPFKITSDFYFHLVQDGFRKAERQNFTGLGRRANRRETVKMLTAYDNFMERVPEPLEQTPRIPPRLRKRKRLHGGS